MQRLSSRQTWFFKRVFPWLWFGFLAVFVIVMLGAGPSTHTRPVPRGLLAAPLVMAVLGYLVFRRLVFNLLDEVWDDGDGLVVRNDGKEERIALRNIVNVGYSMMTRPQRVTLTLRSPGIFGKEVSFSAPTRWLPFGRNPMITELIERVDRARGSV